MSIGKNSIARAVNVTKEATAQVKLNQNNTVIKSFPIDVIGLLCDESNIGDISALKNSIEKRGLLSPVLVGVTEKNEAWLLDGYNRFFASKQLGAQSVEAVVIDVKDKNDINRIYKEITLAKSVNTDSIHEEKFKILAVKDHDLPSYLL